jgi:lysophospholipase L1-like esterase
MATVIGDSLSKWIRGINFTDIQSIPGLNISKCIDRINDRTLTITRYQLILIMLGTNDIQRYSPKCIADKMAELIDLIREKNPNARIACNAIISRPTDIPEQMRIISNRKKPITAANYLPPPPPSAEAITAANYLPPPPPSAEAIANYLPPPPPAVENNQPPTRPPTRQEIYQALHPMEKKRRQTNIQLRRLCKQKNVYFLETWKAMENKMNRSTNLNLYANDGLHLNNHGITALGNYIEGTTACLLDFKKMPKPKRWKRKFGLPTQEKN